MNFDDLRQCLVSALELDETEAQYVRPTTTVADLRKWDSLEHFVLISQLEEGFGIEFRDQEVVRLGSVGAILQAVENRQ